MAEQAPADLTRSVSYAGYFTGMLVGPLVLALIVALIEIDKHNIAHELVALAELALYLAPIGLLVLFVPVAAGLLPFMAIRKFAPQNTIARPLFIMFCFALIWFICIMARIIETQFTNISPYFPSPHPPILMQLGGLLTTAHLMSFSCVVITSALVCWKIDSRTQTNE